MGIAIECILFNTPVRFELMVVPLCMFVITLLQFGYAAILHYGFGDLLAAMDASLYADVQLTVSVCLLEFGLTLYALEREIVPWHAEHVRSLAMALRIWTFHVQRNQKVAIQEYWVVLPAGILSASLFAFYSTVHFVRYNEVELWPPKAFIKSELAACDFPVTRLLVAASVFAYYLTNAECFDAFVYVQPYLYFSHSYRTWGNNNWFNKAIMYASTIAVSLWCSFYLASMTPCLVLVLDVAWRPVRQHPA